MGSLSLMAQVVTIGGQVLDGESNDPLPFASIVVSVAGTGEMVTGSVSAEDGYFSIQGNLQGEYIFSISYLGY